MQTPFQQSNVRLKESLRITSLPVLLASLCCLAPVILVSLGLSSVAFASSLTNVLDGRFRWAFLLAGAVLLAISVRSYLRRQNICTLEQAKRRRTEVLNIVALSVVTAVVAYVVLFYGIIAWLGRALKIW